MRCDALPDTALAQRLPHQPELEAAQIPQAAMNQLGIVCTGGVGKVVLLDERDREAAHRRIPRDTGARDPTANYEEVEMSVGKAVEVAFHREWQSGAAECYSRIRSQPLQGSFHAASTGQRHRHRIRK